MSKKVTAIISYISLLGFLIAYLAGDKEGAKFDLNQALILNIASIVCAVVGRIPYIGIIGDICSLVIFVLAIMGIINAAKGEEKPLPLIGGINIL